MLFRDAAAVTIPWLDRRRWCRRLGREIGTPWLADDPDRFYMIQWAAIANIGDAWHRHEDLWLVIEERKGATVLLADYEEGVYRALRITVATPAVNLQEMD